MIPGRWMVTLGLCSVLFSCGQAPIRVGVAMVLTGINSEIGVSGRNAVELAVEDINAKGGVRGRRLELLIRDDGSDEAQALAVDEELRSKGAVAIIGHMISASGAKAVQAAGEKEFPIISPTISSSDYLGKDDYLFRMLGDSGLQGKALARHAADELKLKRIASLYEDSNRSYTLAVESAFRREFAALGGETLPSQAFKSGSMRDLERFAASLDSQRCDGVLSVAGPADNAKLCAALERRGSVLPVLAGMWSMTPDLIHLGGRSADRMVMAGLMDPDSLSPRFRSFAAAYEKRFGATPSFASVYSYEAVLYLAAALGKAESFSGKDIKKALLSLGRFEGLQDSFTMDRFGDADRTFSIFIIKDGRFVRWAR